MFHRHQGRSAYGWGRLTGFVAAIFFASTQTGRALDQNGNQQSDVWEIYYNATGLTATADSDGDTVNNRSESLAGTDPRDPLSLPELLIDPALQRATWDARPGKWYQLQTATSLTDTWTTVRCAKGDGLPAAWPLTNAPFFRFAVGELDSDGDGFSDWDETAVGFDPLTNRTERYSTLDTARLAGSLSSMSTVTVVAMDADISERWPDPGLFVVRRAGGLRPLTLQVAWSGTATPGADYAPVPAATLQVPAGAREVWVEIHPVADALDAEPTESVILTLLPGSNYVVGAASSATVNLANETDASGPSAKAAARFLLQAAFGPDADDPGDADLVPENVEELMGLGFAAWITNQFARPIGLLQPFVEYAPTISQFYTDPKQAAWWNRAMGVPELYPGGPVQAPDPLRQRVAFALSQIFVISDRLESLGVEPAGMANYYDLLLTHAFGNYYDLLRGVTLHPCMGLYLSHLQNRKPDPINNIFPDENYAREVMQLFSIGLWELNPDGTRRLGTNGLPIPTYDNDTITSFARVFTGLSYGGTNATSFGFASRLLTTPMKMWDAEHDVDPKTLLNGVVLPARTASQPDTGAAGLADLDAAVSNLFLHPNVGPFIGRQLIQRLVTSNPSTGYIARVAAAFANNGAGVRGDLKAVVAAILLDPDARDPVHLAEPGFGKAREPFLRVVNLARAFNASAIAGFYALDAFNLDHYQQPLNSPSVFNFYLPNYQSPGPAGQAGLVAPEFQLLNAGSAISVPNYYLNAIPGGLHRWGSSDPNRTVRLNVTNEMALVQDVDTLLRRIDLSMTGGTLEPRTLQLVREAVLRIQPGLWQWDQERINLALYLVVTSPECSVLR